MTRSISSSARLAVAAVMLSTFAVLVAPQVASGAVTGTGTLADPYVLSTCTELATIDDTTAALSKNYALANDIDCSGVAWTPLVNGTTYFTGSLDGRNHSIDNLTVTCGASTCGFFKRVDGAAVIKNLVFRWANVEAGTYGSVGTVAGSAINASTTLPTFSNVQVVGSRVSASGYNASGQIGGLVGFAYATFTDVSFNGSVEALLDNFVGGIVGKLGDQSVAYNVRITRATSTGSVRANTKVGGIAGEASRSSYVAAGTEGIFNSTNYSNIEAMASGNYAYGGGIAGVLSGLSGFDLLNYGTVLGHGVIVGGAVGITYVTSTIRRAVNFGNITSTNASSTYSGWVGGILGQSSNVVYSNVQQSFNVGTVSGSDSPAGIAGTTTYVNIENSYNRGTINVAAGGNGGGLGGRGSSGSIKTSYAANLFTGTGTKYGASGRTADTPSCTNTFWDTTVSSVATTTCSATSKTTTQLKNVATFTTIATGLTAAWDFVGNPNADAGASDYWNIDPAINDGYPYLVGLPGQARSVAPTLSLATVPASTAYKSYTVMLQATSGDIDCGTVSNVDNEDFDFTNTASVYVFQSTATECAIVITADTSGGTPVNVTIAVGASFSVNGLNTVAQTSLAGTTSYATAVTDTSPATTFLPTTTSTTSTTAAPTAQTISFGSLPDRVYGVSSFIVSATATSNLAVTFSSNTTSVCTVNVATVSIIDIGTCTIQADQIGDASWATAPAVTQGFQVATKALSIVNAAGVNRDYDGTRAASVNFTSAGLSGVVGVDNVGFATTSYSALFATADADINKTVTVAGVTLNGTNQGRYSLVQPTVTATVNRASATVTAGTLNLQHGATVTPSFTNSTLVGSDAISSVTFTYEGTGGTSYIASTTAPTADGTYSITPSAAVFSVGSATNYNINFAAGVLTITSSSSPSSVAPSSSSSSSSTTSTSPSSTSTTVAVTTTTAAPVYLLQYDGDAKASVSESFTIAGFFGSVLTSDGSSFSISKTGLVSFKLKTGYIGKTTGKTSATYVEGGKKKTWSCSIKPFTVGKVNKKAKRSVNSWFPKRLYAIPSTCQIPEAMRAATKSQKIVLAVTIDFVKWWPTTGKAINAETGVRIPKGKRTLKVNIGA